jgi:hypothetical protein
MPQASRPGRDKFRPELQMIYPAVTAPPQR